MAMSYGQKFNFRALFLLIVPLVISACLSTYVIVTKTETTLQTRTAQFGQSIANQMAKTLANSVMNDDRLSINVMLTEQLRDEHFNFASIYDTNNTLIAQVGKRHSTGQIFTKEITKQNEIAGYIQLSFNQDLITKAISHLLMWNLGIHLFFALLVTATYIYLGDFLYYWITYRPRPQKQKPTIPTLTDEPITTSIRSVKTDTPDHISTNTTILVLKIRPTRLYGKYRQRIEAALALYGGEITGTEDNSSGDLMIYFRNTEQMFNGICAGLLVVEIFRQIDSPVIIKAGLHQHENADPEFEKAIKHTSYLASISENQLLTSRTTYNLSCQNDTYNCQSFHSSMAPDGEVFSIEGLRNNALIEKQAAQIFPSP